MAERSTKSSWKVKRRLREQAAKARSLKQPRLTTEESVSSESSTSTSQSMSLDERSASTTLSSGTSVSTTVSSGTAVHTTVSSGTSVPTTASSGASVTTTLSSGTSRTPADDSSDEGGQSESENERDQSSSSSDEDGMFDDDKAQQIFDDWVVSLPLMDRKMLAVVIMETSRKRMGLKKKPAALEAAWITGFNEKTVRNYRNELFENHGKFKDETRGKYKRFCLFNDENLRLQASMWVRENSVRKGSPNLVAREFCQWINNDLLPSADLPPNLPRSITVRTATRWLHKLGFRPTSHKKGAYVDGHERDDVVSHRKNYLDQMKALRDTHLPPPPPTDERAATPPPDAEFRKRLVLIYHDESIFNTNEGQRWAWATGDEPIIQPKTKGAGIMVSDFIEQHDGFLCLSEEAAASAPTPLPRTARVLMEYGAEKEGYWNSEKFMDNVADAVSIAKFKYPSDKNTVVFIFDQSSCHKAYAEDALNVSRMNVRPGGKQPCMRDTMWAGNVQRMVDEDGVPKGMRKVLEERGINTSNMKGPDMRVVLSFHDDFQSEKTIVEHFFDEQGLKCVFLPKFHCELNPIERVWGQAKVYSRSHTNFTLPGLRAIVRPALDSVSTDLMRKYFRRVLEYERAYLEGKKAGKELEAAVKVYKSHRRVFFESQS